MNTLIEATQLKKTYGIKGQRVPVLHGIDLAINEGEFVGIMGPSGSGKTTLLNILATIDQPTSGDLTIDGQPILTMKEEALSAFRGTKLGFIFQEYNLLDTLTVKENILLPLALAHVPAADLEHRVDAVADTFAIRSILDNYPYQISGGQKQRTAAARAIIAQPRLVLADEPTGALDSRSATDLLEALKNVQEQQNATIVMVTHDTFAASYCSRVLFIKDGQIFTHIVKGRISRKEFFKKILDVVTVLGGNAHDGI